MTTTAAQAMVKCLEKEAVSVVFGLPGAAICPFYDALSHSDIPVSYTHLDVYKRQGYKGGFHRVPCGNKRIHCAEIKIGRAHV